LSAEVEEDGARDREGGEIMIYLIIGVLLAAAGLAIAADAICEWVRGCRR
jgi:hypothetical protein